MIALRFKIKKWLASLRFRLRRALIARVPRRSMEACSRLNWRLGSLFSASVKMTGAIRAEIGRDVLKLPHAQSNEARAALQLEKLIDQRIYFGRDVRKGETWPDLEDIARLLAERTQILRREHPNRPVFLSPFHFVSQYANIYIVERVAALLGLESMSVVSGVPRNQYGDDHALIPGIKVLYTYGDSNRGGLGVRVARALRRDGVAVLFSDVPPFTMHRYPMETVGVSMFNRPARVHNGVFRMGATFGAVMLPFYLRFRHGRFESRVFDPVPLVDADAPQRIADCIQVALLDNYQQWTCAGHPSMYAFAAAK
jgi:hypothetical protein